MAGRASRSRSRYFVATVAETAYGDQTGPEGDELRVSGGQLSSVEMLARRMLWNWPAGSGKPSRPQPVIVLLGPVGSGKSHALDSLGAMCGAGVVHARFDFDRAQPITTVEALTRIANGLSREWRNRPAVQFTRFTLGLIAVQVDVDGKTRGEVKTVLRALIDEFARHPAAIAITGVVKALTAGAEAADILPAPVAEAIGRVLPGLIQMVGRKPLKQAARFLAGLPGADGAAPLDALASLSVQAHDRSVTDPVVTAWLTEAFLADVRESHARLAAHDADRECGTCLGADSTRHWHNWMLLLDNIDHPGGTKLVSDLLAARERHLRQHPHDHDALLVVATSGRWNPHWQLGWRPPWAPRSDDAGPARRVPSCSDADYRHWADQPPGFGRVWHYPVLLEALDIDDIAAILEADPYAPRCVLVARATGGLPAAVTSLARHLRGRTVSPGARDVLGSGEPGTAADPWRERLTAARLAEHLPDVGLDDFVTAAPFATAPWFVPHDSVSLIDQPNVGLILTELRTALWVTAPRRAEGTADFCELHPWIAGNLVSALARREPQSSHPSYHDQFTALLDDPATLADPARRAYCQLALGQISDVVSYFDESFDQAPHQRWIDRLDLATRAPDALPLNRPSAEIYAELVRVDSLARPLGRSALRNTVARLVAASWLAANPFAVPDSDQIDTIAKAYHSALPPLSRRPDVAALYAAAQRAAELLP